MGKTKKINKWRHHLHLRRFIIVFCIMAIIFVGLFYRLFYLEAVDNQFPREKGKNESNQTIDLQGKYKVYNNANNRKNKHSKWQSDQLKCLESKGTNS